MHSTSFPPRRVRFAVTHVNPAQLRVLSIPPQAARLFDDRESASAWLLAIRENTPQKTLIEVFGPNAPDSLRVDPVDCHPCGDAVRSVFGMERRDACGHWTPAHFCTDCGAVHIIPRSRAEHIALACRAPLPRASTAEPTAGTPDSPFTPESPESALADIARDILATATANTPPSERLARIRELAETLAAIVDDPPAGLQMPSVLEQQRDDLRAALADIVSSYQKAKSDGGISSFDYCEAHRLKIDAAADVLKRWRL